MKVVLALRLNVLGALLALLVGKLIDLRLRSWMTTQRNVEDRFFQIQSEGNGLSYFY